MMWGSKEKGEEMGEIWWRMRWQRVMLKMCETKEARSRRNGMDAVLVMKAIERMVLGLEER